MNADARTIAEITTELFLQLEQQKLRYAVLRNYERFPHLSADVADHALTDVDLVMHSDDVPAWRLMAASLARDCGWDVLTECPHFCVSRIPEHRIEIFRFYRLSPPACLQVDIFHGFLLWGVPFTSEAAMLAGRVWDLQLNLTRIPRSKENVLRLLQLHALVAEGASRDKLARYRGKVLEHAAGDDGEFRFELDRAFSIHGIQALDALERDDSEAFRRAMLLSKAVFFWRFCSSHPLKTTHCFGERVRDHFLRFVTRQCGFVLNAYAPSDRDRSLLRAALQDLKRTKTLPSWTLDGAERKGVTWKEHRVMERGGVAVKWSSSAESGLDVTQAADGDELTSAVLLRLIARHPSLYRRVSVPAVLSS